MPPPIKAAKLSEIQPTPEELAEAKRALDNMRPNELQSKKVSMASFLKKNPDLKALTASGDEKTKFLQAFYVHTVRCKLAQKKIVATKSITTKKSLHQDLRWWSEEKMDLELGPQKAAHWRQSDLLPTRADRITNSRDPKFLEYGCPEDWESYSEEELRQLKVRVEAELADEDIESLEETMRLGLNTGAGNILMAGQASSSNDPGGATTAATPIAPPTESDGQKMARKMEELKANRESTLLRYNQLLLKMKVIKTRGENEKKIDAEIIAPFLKSLDTKIKAGTKLTKCLERLVTEDCYSTEGDRIYGVIR